MHRHSSCGWDPEPAQFNCVVQSTRSLHRHLAAMVLPSFSVVALVGCISSTNVDCCLSRARSSVAVAACALPVLTHPGCPCKCALLGPEQLLCVALQHSAALI